jgi:Mrp family chromosome partitioning ATPase
VTGTLLGGAEPYAYASQATYAPQAYAPPPLPPVPPVMPVAPRMMAQAPPLVPAQTPVAVPTAASAAPMVVGSIEQIARSLQQGGDAGRRVVLVGAAHNAGTTYAAISLARALAKNANVVLVDMAFGTPNLSVISTEPLAPGLAELIRGSASFGDIITRDQYSRVHLVATGNLGNNAAAISASPMLATVVEALARSYDHVVIDAGAAPEIAVERIAPLAAHGILVAADPAAPSTRAERDRMITAGFGEVTLVAGGAQAAAA